MRFKIVETIIDDAKQEFGTTNNWRKAAYINTDGSMLDFSYGSNRRVDDHRTIGSVYDELDGTDAMLEYVKDGNIRFIPELPAFDMIVEPNEIQYRVIKDLCYDFDELTIDFTNEKGYSVDSIQYDRVTPNKVVSDIKSHFSKGLAESKVRKDLKDLTGQKFGDLTVIEYDKEKSRATGQTYWKCKCSCGKETTVARKHLLNGDVKSCGHGKVQSGLDHYEDNFKGMRDRQNKYHTNLEIIRNQKMQPNNTSGVKGVDYHKGRDSWRARVRVNGKELTRWFKNKEDAVKWRKWAEQEYYQPQIDRAIQAGDLKIEG